MKRLFFIFLVSFIRNVEVICKRGVYMMIFEMWFVYIDDLWVGGKICFICIDFLFGL